jgi:hypothetical protein
METTQVEKRLVWNGRKKVNLRHLANSKWTKYLPILHDLFYEENYITGKGLFYRRTKGIFVKVAFPEELEKVLKERCLKDY